VLREWWLGFRLCVHTASVCLETRSKTTTQPRPSSMTLRQIIHLGLRHLSPHPVCDAFKNRSGPNKAKCCIRHALPQNRGSGGHMACRPWFCCRPRAADSRCAREREGERHRRACCQNSRKCCRRPHCLYAMLLDSASALNRASRGLPGGPGGVSQK
jgi:hypothetical protein